MTEPRVLAIFDDYRGLIDASRARVAEIGMTFDTLDQIAGWADRYATKILTQPPAESGAKRPTHRFMGPTSFGELGKSIGVKWALIDDPAQLARIKRHPDFKRSKRPLIVSASMSVSIARKPGTFTHDNAGRMGVLRAQKISPRKRRAIAKKAARARWGGIRPKMKLNPRKGES